MAIQQGPSHHHLSPNLQCSPLGVVPKKDGTWRIIMDLSSPHGSSINDYISKDEFTLHYATFDQALSLVAHHGRNALMAKLDIKHLSDSAQFAWKTVSYSASTGRGTSTLTFASPLACDLPLTSSTAWPTPLSGY